MTYTSRNQLVESLKNQISTRDSVAIRALLTIYEFQSDTEKSYKDTIGNNNVGFMGVDAKFASSLVEFYNKTGFLTEKQMNFVKKMMPKYSRQLINKSLNEGKIRKEGNVYVW